MDHELRLQLAARVVEGRRAGNQLGQDLLLGEHKRARIVLMNAQVFEVEVAGLKLRIRVKSAGDA